MTSEAPTPEMLQIKSIAPAVDGKYYLSKSGDIFVKLEGNLIRSGKHIVYIDIDVMRRGDVAPYNYDESYVIYEGIIYRRLKPWNSNPVLRLDTVDGDRPLIKVRTIRDLANSLMIRN